MAASVALRALSSASAPRAASARRLVIELDQAVEGDGPVGQGAGLVEAHARRPGPGLRRREAAAPGHWRRASVTAAAPKAMLVSSTSPCGTMPTSAATVEVAASCRSSLGSASWLRTRSTATGGIAQRDVAQDLVDARDQLGANQREAPRLRRQFPGVCVGAHPGGLVVARPGDHEAARQQPIADLLVHRLGLAGEQRLVGLQARAGPHHPVGHQLVAGAQVDQIVGTTSSTAISCGAPSRITRTWGALSTASRSSVRLARSSCPMPTSALVTSTMPNRASCGCADGQDHGQQHAQDQVEPGQDVRAQDVGDRAAGAFPARVRQPPRAPLADLRGAQPNRWRLHGRRNWRRRCRGGRMSQA